jgi:hypothetical protein
MGQMSFGPQLGGRLQSPVSTLQIIPSPHCWVFMHGVPCRGRRFAGGGRRAGAPAPGVGCSAVGVGAGAGAGGVATGVGAGGVGVGSGGAVTGAGVEAGAGGAATGVGVGTADGGGSAVRSGAGRVVEQARAPSAMANAAVTGEVSRW